MLELGFLGITVVAALGMAFLFLHQSRLIHDTPTSRIRSAHQGYVELEGVGRLMGKETVCPLTDTPCLWWFYKVEEKRGSGKNSKWVTLEKEISEEPFYLEDATGRCVVKPSGAEVIHAKKRVWYGSRPEAARNPHKSVWLFQRYRFTERFLWRDQPLYALGEFRTVNPQQGPEREAVVREKLTSWKADPARMKLFDVDGDGKVSMKEWDAARRVAQREAEREHYARPPGDLINTLCSTGRQSEKPFILSARPQHEVMTNLRRAAMLSFAWFVGGGALLVWLLQEQGIL